MEEKTNWNQIIGTMLIFGLVYVWMTYFMPKAPQTSADLEADKIEQTSDAVTEAAASIDSTQQSATPSAVAAPAAQLPDSVMAERYGFVFGAFGEAAVGEEKEFVLENDLVKITFTSKGGKIKDVFVKDYLTSGLNGREEIREALHLMDDVKNRFSYELNVQSATDKPISTENLFFGATQDGNTLTFRAPAGAGKYFEQKYTLAEDNYTLNYTVDTKGLDNVLKAGTKSIKLTWDNYLNKLEKSQTYERMYSSVYYKQSDENVDYCDCRGDDTENLGESAIDWFSHSNQFFNTSFVAKNFKFSNFVGTTQMYEDENEDLKLLKTEVNLPLNGNALDMMVYVGPNEFERLKALGSDMQDIIPFGSSIFGAINRWFIHPVFTFLSKYVGSMGIVILLLTIFVKGLVYPLTYKMIHSQSKMQALKPHLEKLRKKHGDDQQAISMETMKMYQEYGVNPLGGCFPIFLQMPIWFALYRFFPAAIEFRQAPFWWASDLSSYDVAFYLPEMLPMIGGSHVSLFTLVWVITTIFYTWYNMRHMDMSQGAMAANPAMKYMQYGMPVMFLFFFNGYASGLSAYLAFSNVFNILQTIITKNYLIDHDKIAKKLEANKAKPKKKSAFRARMEEAMKEQQKKQGKKK